MYVRNHHVLYNMLTETLMTRIKKNAYFGPYGSHVSCIRVDCGNLEELSRARGITSMRRMP